MGPVGLFFGVGFLLGGIVALIRPTSSLWWGPKDRPRPHWQMHGMNFWMFTDEDGREPSQAAIVVIRVVGCIFLVVGCVLLVQWFR